MALKAVARKIVDRRKQNQPQKPEQHSCPVEVKKPGGEDDLYHRDVHRQTPKLLARSLGTEEKSSLTRIEAINLRIGNIIPAVDDQAQRKGHIKQTNPESC